jgi:hypothetical protein
MTRVKDPNDIPAVPHYAVIVYGQSSVHIPGDERSKQCPGHGYPAHYETFDTFEHWVSTDLEAAQDFAVSLESKPLSYGEKKKPFVILHVQGKAVLNFAPSLSWMR